MRTPSEAELIEIEQEALYLYNLLDYDPDEMTRVEIRQRMGSSVPPGRMVARTDFKPLRTRPQACRMRNIRVTFRAVFQQPTGKLNPMGLKMAVSVPVEIFGQDGNWKARDPSRIANAFARLGKFNTAEDAKREIARSFATQLQD